MATENPQALVAQLRQALSVRNAIENGRRREPADTRRLAQAHEDTEAVLRQLEQWVQTLTSEEE